MSTTATGSPSALPPTTRAVRTGRRQFLRALIIVVVVFGALVSFVRTQFDDPPPKGPRGSSFATSRGGVGAFADLAKGAGFRIDRLQRRPGTTPALGDRDTTLVVLGTQLDFTDRAAVFRAVTGGARLIADIDAESGTTWLPDAVPMPRWLATGVRPNEVGPVTPASAATTSRNPGQPRELRVLGLATFEPNPSASPVPGRVTLANLSGAPLALRFPYGRGEIIALADATFLSNELLAESDNAAFGLSLLDGRSLVRFAEAGHGYGAEISGSPTGLPWRVRWFLLGLIGAVVVFMWSRSRRNGPPELAERELAPPRSAYVDAMVVAITPRRRLPFPRTTDTARPPSGNE